MHILINQCSKYVYSNSKNVIIVKSILAIDIFHKIKYNVFKFITPQK